MRDLLFLILLGFWTAGIGLAVLDVLQVMPRRFADALALALPTGLGLLGLGTLGLAELGGLTLGGCTAFLAAGLGFATIARRNRRGAFALGERSKPRCWVDRGVDLARGVGLAGTLLTALTPVTDGDALCYHLQVPKVFLEAGAATFDPDLHETVYPLLTEMVYAVSLAVASPVACRLVQWLFGVAFVLGVMAVARPVLGDRAGWAGAVALLVPAVSNGMGAPLNDVALAAMGTATLVAWLGWWDAPSRRSAGLAGLLAGLALGVKYPAIVWVGLLGVGMVVRAIGENGQRRRRLGEAAVFGVVAILVGGGWYLRAYLATGNPVYPFFRQTFGGAGLAEVLDPIKRPLPVTPLNLLTAIVPMTLFPSRFDSVSHQFGPAFLLFLPGLFLLRPPRRVVGIVLLGYVFLTVCLTQRQSMRFVLIAVGPLSVGVAWVAARAWERRGLIGTMAGLLLVLMLLGESAIAARRARHGIAVVFGHETREDFLHRREPTYRVARWVDAQLPAEARIVGQDHRGFYFPRPYTMELAHRRRTGVGARDEPPERIVADLRAAGFTHLLLCPPVPETAVEFDGTLGRRLAPWLTSRRPLYSEAIVDPDGVVRRYAIYQLDDGGDRVASRTLDEVKE